MKFKIKYSVSFLIFVSVCFLFTSFAKADEVDKYVQSQMAEQHIPGVAIAVIKNGKAIKTKGYGVSSFEFNAPVTAKTVFEIGSVSKQITSAAIMLLVEDGKVILDEKISKYLPDTPETWKDVTVRHLLTHTSGIQSYTRLGGFELYKRYKVGDFIKELGQHQLEFQPGTSYRYNNSGYNLLGFIIESASGKTYWDFLRERIYQPLGMNLTAERDPQFIIRNRATGYEWRNDKFVGRDYILTDLFSAGAIVSTVEDLAKWDIALRDESLLKNSSKNEMWTPYTLNKGEKQTYGLGWNVTEFRGQKLLRHGGQTAGFASNISRYIDSDLSVIVLTNLGTQGLGSSISHGIAKIYIPSISLKSLKTQTESNSKINELFSKAINEITQNNFSPEILTENLIKTLSSDASKKSFQRISSFGKIKKIDFIEIESSDNKKIYRYRVETPKRLFLWRISVNDEGKISEMVLEEEE